MRKKVVGENPKAEAAKAAKAARAAERQAQIEKAIEDAKWVDDDKYVMRKQRRKELRERKAYEAAARKAELRKLAEAEMAAAVGEATGKTPQTSTSVMLYELETCEEQQETEKTEEERKLAQQKIVVINQDEPLEENINRLVLEEEEDHSVKQAMNTLRDDFETTVTDIDRNQKKRLKAAYEAYEAKRLQALKKEKPRLGLLQLKKLIKTEWKKAPEFRVAVSALAQSNKRVGDFEV